MDDFCKKQNVFLSTDDKMKFTVEKSKSQFSLFKNTVNNAFKKVKVYPEVPGLDQLTEDTRHRSQESTRRIAEISKKKPDYKSQRQTGSDFGKN